MQWSDVTKAPSPKTLRQFAGLCLVVFGGLAAWRLWQGHADARAAVLGALAVGLGVTGLIRPTAVRLVFTGWMIAAFPIGWLVSRVVLALLFYAVFTPVALVFRLAQRDVLHRRRQARTSYWTPKAGPADVREYFRQF
jgi:hypothetical protein